MNKKEKYLNLILQIDNMAKYKYIKIIKEKNIYKIWNNVYEQYVGEIRRERMGQWMHWQLFQYPGCGFTNGCLKEISSFITTLYKK